MSMSKDAYGPIQGGLADYLINQSMTPKEIALPSNTQVGGNHYKNFVIQPYKFCYENKLNNLQSEIVSYVVRYPYKWANNKPKQIEDLKKAQHTIALLIEQLENE